MKILLSLVFLMISVFAHDNNIPKQEDILIVSTSMGAKREIRKNQLFNELLQPYALHSKIVFDNDIDDDTQAQEKLFNGRKLIILTALNGKSATMPMRQKYEMILKKLDSKVIVTGVDAANSINLSKKFVKPFLEYLENGGKHNYAQAVKMVVNEFLGKNELLEKVIHMPKTGIYNYLKNQITFESLDDYYKALSEKERLQPKVGIAIHRETITSDDTEFIDQSIDMLLKQDITPIVFFTQVGEEDFVGKRFIVKDTQPVVDLLISYQIMIINEDKLKAEYEQLQIPIMQGIIYRDGEAKDWFASKEGIDARWIPMMYSIPEKIGYADPLVIAAVDKKSKKAIVLPNQLQSFINKAANIIKLAHFENKEKRVALFYYNYPPGVNNFGASFMDFPASVEMIAKAFEKQGYDTQAKNSEFYLDAFSKSMQFYYKKTIPDQNNTYADYLDASAFEAYLNTLPQYVQKEMLDAYGSYKNSNLYVEHEGKGHFIIPRLKQGNIIYLPQPTRTSYNNKDKEQALYHDRAKPLPYAYQAVYLYARLHSDAFIHLGTHGTYEWSLGKERGLSIYDSGYLAVGDIPVFYPYITNNLAEGIQAKRRGRATLISHQTPPFGLSGTYKELSDIMNLISQYNESFDDVKKETYKNLKALVISMNIHKDMKYTQEMIDKEPERFTADLYDYLNGISTSYTPLGMHTFGSHPKGDRMVQTVMAMLGDKFIELIEGKDGLKGINYQDINKSKSYTILNDVLIKNKPLDEYQGSVRSFLEVAKEYQSNFLNNEEIKALLDALNGKYIKTSGGGDPIRNPESLPTGKNMYSFDPDRIPTPAAYESGKKLMNEYLANYYATHGSYPRKITFNLWSLETMRHFGVLESQILYAMGVKPVWSKGGISDDMLQSMALGMLNKFLPESFSKWCASFVTVERVDFFSFIMPEKMRTMFKESIKSGRGRLEGIEIIPYNELKRPRIDVVVQATGLYRDAFPAVMMLINKGVDKITNLKEEHNYLRQNSLTLHKELIAKGYDEDNATMLSTIRMFSAARSSYGNGVEDTAMESQTWEEEGKMADNFIRKSGYLYGSDKSTWGTKLPDIDLFSKNLSGTQAVIFSRTSNLYGLLTSDDPFGYFGSLALAVRKLDGKSPDMVIANLRNPNKAHMQNVDEFIANEFRTRYFNPKWIKAMQEVGYSGATNVLDVTNNFWGWQVVYPEGVRSDQWQELVEIYVKDKYNLKTREWFKQTNPTAMAQITERILEAIRKGYFQTDTKTIQTLVETQKEFAKHNNHEIDNEKLKKFIQEEIAAGYGLKIQIAKPVVKALEARVNPPKKAEPQVTGQKLEEKEQVKDHETNNIFKYTWLVILLLILIGMWAERRKYK